MELTQEKKTQIAACHDKGMTPSVIAARCGLTEGAVTEFLESIGKTPNKSERRKNNRLTDEQIKKIGDLISQGKGTTEIGRTMGISVKTADYYRRKIAKEKEPATAATVTDSMDTKTGVCDTVSASKYTIAVRKSQAQRALDNTKETLLSIYENMTEDEQRIFDLGEAFGRICSAIEEEDDVQL